MIDPLPELDRTASTFKTDCDTFFGTELPAFSVQVEAARVAIVASEVATAASAAAAAADAVLTDADRVATAADRVQTGQDVVAANGAAAAAAGYAAALSGSSATSLLIAVASKSFPATTGRQWGVGQFLVAASAANPANFMHGQVTSYNAGTGALVLNVLDVGGSGTYADWVITLSAPKGDTGSTGASGKLTRSRVTGTTQAAANGFDYLLVNPAATAVTAPTAADLVRFKVTSGNRLKTNTINFGSDTYIGPLGTGTGVVTMNRGIPMEWEYSSADTAWILL